MYALVILVLGMLLTAGGYMLQRDKYWRHVWQELGEPEVKSIKELKALYLNHEHARTIGLTDYNIKRKVA